MGYYRDGKLYYAEKVKNGFVAGLRRDVFKRFGGLEVETCPFVNLPEKKRTVHSLTREEMKNCVWAKPKLDPVARAEKKNDDWTAVCDKSQLTCFESD